VSFEQWLQLLTPYQTQCYKIMRPILAAHLNKLIAQHVVYTEIMLSPAIFPREPEAMLHALHEWREWTLELEQRKLQVEYLMVIPRTLTSTILEHDLETMVRLRRAKLIVGVALVGLETGESLQRFSHAFARWREAGLGIEIHAGEHSGSDSVRDALRFGRPHRLGHCLSAFQDPRLVETISSSRIHVEFCPTSNLRSGAVSDLKEHPIGRALELGLNFSVNTDDPGAFGTSMENEYRLLAETFGFNRDEFTLIFRNSLASRFEPKLRYLNRDAMDFAEG
jgi:adenosine deaminase